MSLSIKPAVIALTGDYARVKATEGWKFKKTKFEFHRKIAPGLNLVVCVGWTFKGVFASGSPIIHVYCDLVSSALKLSGCRTKPAPTLLVYGNRLGEPRLGRPKLHEATHERFAPDKGDFYVEEIFTYYDLLTDTSVRFLMDNYDVSSQRGFIASCPSDYEFIGPYWDDPSFVAVQLLKGNNRAIPEYHAIDGPTKVERYQGDIARLEANQREILALNE